MATASNAPGPTDYWVAINGSVSALTLVIAGILGVGRYRKERPYFARANLTLVAELFTVGQNDFVSACVGATSIGKQAIELIPSSLIDPGCFVAIYDYRGEPPGDSSTLPTPIAGVPVFGKGQEIDSGELVEDAVILPVGVRDDDVVAYRVEFGFEAVVPLTFTQKYILGQSPTKYSWKATTFVMAGRQADGWLSQYGHRCPGAGAA